MIAAISYLARRKFPYLSQGKVHTLDGEVLVTYVKQIDC